MFLEPSAAASSAAFAAIQAKMPVVMGQPIVARCLFAREERIWLIVVRRPGGTRFISQSTSFGEGITTVPLPQRTLILGVIGSTRGNPLLSASFSRHDLRARIATDGQNAQSEARRRGLGHTFAMHCS